MLVCSKNTMDPEKNTELLASQILKICNFLVVFLQFLRFFNKVVYILCTFRSMNRLYYDFVTDCKHYRHVPLEKHMTVNLIFHNTNKLPWQNCKVTFILHSFCNMRLFSPKFMNIYQLSFYKSLLIYSHLSEIISHRNIGLTDNII